MDGSNSTPSCRLGRYRENIIRKKGILTILFLNLKQNGGTFTFANLVPNFFPILLRNAFLEWKCFRTEIDSFVIIGDSFVFKLILLFSS